MLARILRFLRRVGLVAGYVDNEDPLWARYKRLHAKLISGTTFSDADREEMGRSYIHGIRGRRVLMPDESIRYVTGVYAKDHSVFLQVGPSADRRSDVSVDGATVTVL